jgi:hypothetical protein
MSAFMISKGFSIKFARRAILKLIIRRCLARFRVES